MIAGIHHSGLAVRDLDRAIAFYRTFGAFEVCDRFAITDSVGHRQLLALADATAEAALLRGTLGCLMLMAFPGSAQEPPIVHGVSQSGIRHICLQTVIDDAFFDAMLAAGASSHARPSGLGTGNSYAYIRDPEGNVLELEGVPWATPAATTPWYAHSAVVTPDIDRLTEFYAMLTGATVHRRGSFGPDRKFDIVAGIEGVRFHGAWMRLANAELEFWQYLHPASLPTVPHVISTPGWSHLCFESTDIAADRDRLAQAGVPLFGPPQRLGGAIMAFGRDPDGNLFALLEPVSGRAGPTVAAMRASAEAVAIETARGTRTPAGIHP
ncbi:VOC family protein [Sandaracinobacteroides saxicola]|uniref:VOC family protein n=1 Tax=Sandaracinobacteroides saxicola TaxID=2759707 RepID=A0A7G5ILI0_9SPHN|nr:VOC family protein [Sandaracinobacteroides saxicola]QMW24222.1 VOC family protein [Sandaracinobacteroides saxicola]